MSLTDTKVKNAKPKEDGKPRSLSDGLGLSLLVEASGKKYWRFRFNLAGKARLLSLGIYPAVTLLEARKRRDEARSLVAKGVNPLDVKNEKKQHALFVANNTFKSVGNDWFAVHLNDKSEDHKRRVKRWLEFYLYPHLGERPISELTAPMVLKTTDILIRQSKLDTAHRIIQTADQVFRHGITRGFALYNPVPNLKGAIPPAKVKNMAAIIEPDELAKLLRSIDAYKGSLTVQSALKLAPLIFQRIGELRHMRWSELDFERREWRYLVTKGNKQHIVPLSSQAIEVLERMKPFSGHGTFVFPGARTHERPMSENAINAALQNMGYDTQMDITGHGFRAVAQTLGEQELEFDAKHIERQLAHAVNNPLGTAYERAQFLKARKVMMQRWADYLDSLKNYPLAA